MWRRVHSYRVQGSAILSSTAGSWRLLELLLLQHAGVAEAPEPQQRRALYGILRAAASALRTPSAAPDAAAAGSASASSGGVLSAGTRSALPEMVLQYASSWCGTVSNAVAATEAAGAAGKASPHCVTKVPKHPR